MRRGGKSHDEEKEWIKGSPRLLVDKAKEHFYGKDVSNPIQIEISLKGDSNKLILMSKFLYLGDPTKGCHEFDEAGTAYFRDLLPKFKSVLVQVAYSEVKSYPDYDRFLDEIMT